MIVAKIEVSGVRVNMVYRDVVPAGIIGADIEISYTDDIWRDLRKTVVFRGAVTKDVVTDDSIVTIPPEVVATPNTALSVGVYGVDTKGNIAVPTLWADIGYIRPATDPSGDTTTAPSLPVWAQIKQIADDAKQQAQSVRDDADTGRFDGAQGAPGADGKTPEYGVDYGTPEQIAGIAQSAAEILRPEVNQIKDDVATITPDDTTVDGKPWTSKKIVDSLCQPIEESGNHVQVYPVENYPLGVKVSWEPTQAGEGDPSPDNIRPITGRDAVSVTRCGKNLLDFSSFANYTNWRADIATEGNAPTNDANKGYILPVNPSKTYTISFEFLGDTFPTYLYVVKSVNGVSERYAYITTGEIVKKVVSFTPADNEIWYLRMGVTAYENLFNAQIKKITYIQLELGSTATPYEPYTGSTTDIALPETVYGGTLDVETGVVITTLGHIASYTGEALPGEWISDRDVYSSGAVPTTGAQVVYKLTEPITIQLTPQQIAAFSGVNTIYTDAGTLTVTGREDPKHTITELKNAILSLGGNI